MGLGVLMLLATLGLAISISAADIGPGQDSDAKTFGIGAGIWAALSLLIALFLSGHDRRACIDDGRPDGGDDARSARLVCSFRIRRATSEPVHVGPRREG
jgi:hypothetical protein